MSGIIAKIKKWYKKRYQILTEAEAIEFGMTWVRDIYGDEINQKNCRSEWTDGKWLCRVHTLYYPIEFVPPGPETTWEGKTHARYLQSERAQRDIQESGSPVYPPAGDIIDHSSPEP